MGRAGSYRHEPNIDDLTPFPVPWSYPSAEDELKRPKYPKWKDEPFPMDQWRFKAPTFDPFPHQKNPDIQRVPAKHQLVLNGARARVLTAARSFVTLGDGTTVQARLILRPGEKITGNTRVYVAKVKSPKQAGTTYPVYILRIQPKQPKHPGKNATAEEADRYNTKLLHWQYRFDRAGYWDTVRFLKQQRADIVEQARLNYEKQLEKAKRSYYRQQSRARIEYERKVSEAQASYKQALREYQVSKIGSYYGNKYFSLYGSYYD